MNTGSNMADFRSKGLRSGARVPATAGPTDLPATIKSATKDAKKCFLLFTVTSRTPGGFVPPLTARMRGGADATLTRR